MGITSKGRGQWGPAGADATMLFNDAARQVFCKHRRARVTRVMYVGAQAKTDRSKGV